MNWIRTNARDNEAFINLLRDMSAGCWFCHFTRPPLKKRKDDKRTATPSAGKLEWC